MENSVFQRHKEVGMGWKESLAMAEEKDTKRKIKQIIM